MPMSLECALREKMDGWRDDLCQEWRLVVENVEPDYDADGVEREIDEQQQPIFPGRRQNPPVNAPQGSHMFRAFDDLPPSAVKVVLIGEDPYPAVGRATGRSFEDGSRRDNWLRQDNRYDSMVGIAQQLASFLTGRNEYSTADTGIREMRQDIENGNLMLANPRNVFHLWQTEGVLMLNTALTHTHKDHKKYHRMLWEPIVQRICCRLARRCQSVVFMCLGNEAEKFLDRTEIKVYLITNNRLVVRGHPNPNPRTREVHGHPNPRTRDFLYGNGGFLGEENVFCEANVRLAALGRCPVLWHCP